MLRGIDVSDWQPDIDWSAVAGAGYSFAIVKATQGTGNVQYTLAPYRSQAPAAGIGPFGMYHFAANGDPVAQADHFCDVVGTLGPDEFAALDIEHNTTFFTLPESQWPAFIISWCERVESRLGGPVVVYMSESPASSMPDSVGRWPLWVAGYVRNTPTAWDDWRVGPWSPSIWQHTSTAHVPGVGNCDANIAPDDLRSRLGFQDSPAPAPVPKEELTMIVFDGPSERGGGVWKSDGVFRNRINAGETWPALESAGAKHIGVAPIGLFDDLIDADELRSSGDAGGVDLSAIADRVAARVADLIAGRLAS